LVDKN